MKQPTLRPGDVSVALQLALGPDASFPDLARSTWRSLGETHNAVERLRVARIVAAERRATMPDPLLEFLRWGVPYAYPPIIGGLAVGVVTAQLTEPLASGSSTSPNDAQVQSGHDLVPEYVWPSAEGLSRGQALVPLYPSAPRLADSNPRLFRLMSLVDVIRIGGARERSAAIDAITALITKSGS